MSGPRDGGSGAGGDRPAAWRPRAPKSLRGRLTLANIVLFSTGLLLAVVASLVSMYAVLVGDIDETLAHQRASVQRSLTTDAAAIQVCTDTGADGRAGGSPLLALTQHRLVVLSPSGAPVARCAHARGRPAEERREIAAATDDPASLAASGDGRTVDVGADGAAYRIGVIQLSDGGLLVSAIPLDGVRHAVFRFIGFEALSAAVLLTLLTAGTLFSARRQLRPLQDMVQTASAIAEGDLTRRVSRAGSSTEVVELRNALNAMLHQVESAFVLREQGTEQLQQFVADASHELRTPIATIRGYAQLFARGMLSEEEQERARDRIAAEADRMAHLVEELMTLARFDHAPRTDMKPVDLTQLVRDGAADLRAQEPDRPVTVQSEGHVHVLGDQTQLRKVIGNLLSNVRTYTPARSPVALWTSEQGTHAVLRIADSGPGMRQEDANRVFDRFFRADPGRARASGGSGLGMSIVRAVVEAHAGSVRLVTAPGEGLTVEVRLPLRAVPGAPVTGEGGGPPDSP